MMRLVMGIHLFWQKIEVAMVALIVPGLIVESSIANGWVYTGGSFANVGIAAIGLLRGFFFEALTYAAARQAFLMGKERNWFGGILMGLVSLAAMYVSAVNNLGWVMAGHDLAGLFSTLGTVMGDGPLYHGYQFFLAVLLPISVGAIALVPLDRFFQHALEQDHLDNHALLVDERSMHRTAYLKAQRKQTKVIQEAYEEIAEDRAQTFVEQVRQGDLSFGAGGTLPPAALPSGSTTNRLLTAPRREVTGTVWPVDRASAGGEQAWSPSEGQWSETLN